MKKVLLGAGIVVSLLAALPATSDAAAPPIVNRDPSAGTPGQQIGVSGRCQPDDEVILHMSQDTYSDVATTVGRDSLPLRADSTGLFYGYLTNRTTKSDLARGPIDLEIVAICKPGAADNSATATPYTSQERVAPLVPRLYTMRGPGTCGFGNALGAGAIACPAHFKGFLSDGTVGINEYSFPKYSWSGFGGSIALGDLYNTSSFQAAVATGPGVETRVSTTAFAPAHERFEFVPFPGFTGGVSLAAGNVFGDARDEIIVGANPGGSPHVKAYTFDGAQWKQVASFFAYDSGFRGGVSVAAADLNGDGQDEIITGAGRGGGPHVRIFNASGNPIGGFFAYASNFSGGVQVAGGQIGDNPSAQIVTAPGEGGGPHIRVFNGDGSPDGPGFYAYDKAFNGAISVSVGFADPLDMNKPAVKPAIATAPLSGGAPHVRIFRDASGRSDGPGFYAYSQGWRSGVQVALANRSN